MKRFCSLLFLTLIILNTVGYYGILMIIDEQHREHTLDKISENVNQISGNLVLRIPMSLPYRQDDHEYRRTNGEIVYEGEVYRFIKQMVHNDTLYIVCLRDTRSTEVRNALATYSKTFAGEQRDTSARKDIALFAKFYVLENPGWSRVLGSIHSNEFYRFIAAVRIFHPPCQISSLS
jgi:hypothetical protein